MERRVAEPRPDTEVCGVRVCGARAHCGPSIGAEHCVARGEGVGALKRRAVQLACKCGASAAMQSWQSVGLFWSSRVAVASLMRGALGVCGCSDCGGHSAALGARAMADKCGPGVPCSRRYGPGSHAAMLAYGSLLIEGVT